MQPGSSQNTSDGIESLFDAVPMGVALGCSVCLNGSHSGHPLHLLLGSQPSGHHPRPGLELRTEQMKRIGDIGWIYIYYIYIYIYIYMFSVDWIRCIEWIRIELEDGCGPHYAGALLVHLRRLGHVSVSLLFVCLFLPPQTVHEFHCSMIQRFLVDIADSATRRH